MSAKERDRLKILHEVKKRHITQKQAAAELGLSVRWCEPCWYAGERVAMAHWGMAAWATVEPQNAGSCETTSGELSREKKQAKLWHDYGPTLAAEELAEKARDGD